MLILTLFLSVVLSVWGGRLLFRRTKSYVVYLFEVMFLLFFVVRPFSLTFLGGASFDLKRFGIGDGPVLTYSLCGLIFSAVFHFAVFRLYGRRRLFSDRMLRFCDFDDVSNGRFAFVFLVFVLITYVAN